MCLHILAYAKISYVMNMNVKEIKKLLLNSKEAILKKDFDTALQNCKAVLAVDDNNYNAIVFLGAIYQETSEPEKSVAAFRKATEISPNQLLAWQGLRLFYEKEKPLVHAKDLENVYIKLVELLSENPLKKAEVLNSLAVLYHDEFKDLPKSVDCILQATEMLPSGHNLEATLKIVLVTWLSLECQLDKKFLTIFIESMRDISRLQRDSGNLELAPSVIHSYFNHLLKSRKYTLVVDEAKILSSLFPATNTTKYCLEAYIYSCVDGITIDLDNLDVLIELANGTDGCQAYGHLAKGTRHYIMREWPDAKIELASGLKMMTSNCWAGLLLSCRVSENLHDGVQLENWAREGLKVTENEPETRPTRKAEFQLFLVKGIFLQKDSDLLLHALLLLTEIVNYEPVKPEALFYQGMIELKMQNWQKVQEAIANLKLCPKSDYYLYALQGCLHKEVGEYQLSNGKFEAALQICADDAFVLLQLGSLYYSSKEYPAAYNIFLQAAKADPYNAKAFLMIGHYNNDVLNDKRKAVRCYRLAFNLDNYDVDVGIALSDCYRELGEDAANLDLLKAVTTNARNAHSFWAWLRLGILYLHTNEPELAITSLQAALRTNPTNRECWECLAESYLLRGSHTSALKAFSKAIELEPHLLYCKYQIANIKLSLGFYSEAIEAFGQILENMPSYVPALKGLGEAHLFRVRHYVEKALTREALTCGETALEFFARAVVLRPEFSCLWKRIGDVIIAITSKIPNAAAKVPSKLLDSNKNDNDEYILLGIKDLLTLAERCYRSAVNLHPSNSYLWHDVGIANYKLAFQFESLAEKKTYLEKAFAALKKAISLNPNQSCYWSALGVVSCFPDLQNFAFAQHAFIQAIKARKTDFVAWTNLGITYLINDNIQLANKAFNVAQSIEPSYLNAWIGQALCAETVGHHETLDLFRHCTSLGYHPESYLGYSSWVCSTILDPKITDTEVYRYNIERLAAIPAATDCISHYTNAIKDDPCAYNIFGLLLERMGLKAQSNRAFKRAHDLLSVEHKNMESVVEHISFVRSNHARLLSRLGFYEEAASEASSVMLPDFYNTYCKAAAYYNAGLNAKSDQAYDEALQVLAETDEEKSHLKMAMASVIYQLQGADAAKTPLYECIQYKPPCVQSLLALAAVGLLESDEDLAIAAVHELEQMNTNSTFATNINHVQSLLLIAQGHQLDARNVICKAIHMTPSNWYLWKDIGVHLLNSNENDAHTKEMALNCLMAALKLCRTPSMETLQIVSFCFISVGKFKQGILAAEKLVHLFPGDTHNWQILHQLYETTKNTRVFRKK